MGGGGRGRTERGGQIGVERPKWIALPKGYEGKLQFEFILSAVVN